MADKETIFIDADMQNASGVSPCQGGTFGSIGEADEFMNTRTTSLLRNCTGEIVGGIPVPATAPGRTEFSVREFAALVEGIPVLIEPKSLKEIITLILDTRRADGSLAEKITFDGLPVYGSENDGGSALDLPQAVVNLLWHSFMKSGDIEFVKDTIHPISDSLKTLPKNPHTSLIFIDPAVNKPHRASLFTDRLHKKGDLLIASLLYARACRQLGDLFQSADQDGKADMWRAEGCRMAKKIRMHLWDKQAGLFRASSHGTNQHDIWGSALAVFTNLATSGQIMSICDYIKTNYDKLFQAGQMRHFPANPTNRNAAEPSRHGQNGGFWSYPVGWAAYSLNIIAPEFADRLVTSLANNHAANGVHQWTNGAGLHGVTEHLASAAMPLNGISRILEKRRQRQYA